MWRIGLLVSLCTGCALFSFDAKTGEGVRVLGSRGEWDTLGLVRNVYFTALDTVDLHTSYGDFPYEVRLSPGTHTIAAVCEFRSASNPTDKIVATKRFKQRFRKNHIYRFDAKLNGQAGCELTLVDQTLEEFKARAAEAEASERANATPAAAPPTPAKTQTPLPKKKTTAP